MYHTQYNTKHLSHRLQQTCKFEAQNLIATVTCISYVHVLVHTLQHGDNNDNNKRVSQYLEFYTQESDVSEKTRHLPHPPIAKPRSVSKVALGRQEIAYDMLKLIWYSSSLESWITVRAPVEKQHRNTTRHLSIHTDRQTESTSIHLYYKVGRDILA